MLFRSVSQSRYTHELIDGGIASNGSGGFLTTPPKNLTKPPKVSGLTANGAFAAIYVQWIEWGLYCCYLLEIKKRWGKQFLRGVHEHE